MRAVWVRWEFVVVQLALLFVVAVGVVASRFYDRFREFGRRLWIQFVGMRCAQVAVFFGLALILVGYEWFLHPAQFLKDFVWRVLVMYGGSTSVSSFREASPIGTRWEWITIAGARNALGAAGLGLALLYACAEPAAHYLGRRGDPISLYRRVTLAMFAGSYTFVLWLVASRRTAWYLLPVVPLVFLLGLDVFHREIVPRLRRSHLRRVALVALILLVGSDCVYRGILAWEWRVSRMEKPDDVAYELGDWLTRTYPVDVRIVTDQRDRTYVPSAFKHVEYLDDEAAGASGDLLPSSDPRPTIWVFNTTPGIESPLSAGVIEELRAASGVRRLLIFHGVHQVRNITAPARFEVFGAIERRTQ